MAWLAPLLGPLATLLWRGLGRRAAVSGNHFLMTVLLVFAMNPQSMTFLLMVAGLVLFFPFSSDPLRRIPEERLRLLPLSVSERIRIRVLSLFLSPVVWVALVLPIWGGRRYVGVSLALLLLAFVSNGMSLLWSRNIGGIQRFSLLRHLPTFPGPLGWLVTKNLREMLHVLDPYAGFFLAIAAAIYRFTSPRSVPDTMHGVTLLVALTLSSYAQCLFALDSENASDRYRLMPIRGWQVLLAKDLAFILILMTMVLPLSPLPGLAAGLVLLTFGHRPSVLDPQRQSRWSFVSGARGWSGPVQIIAMFLAGTAVYRLSLLVIIPCVAGYLVSLFHYGARFETR